MEVKGLCTRGGGKSILFGDFKFIHIAKHVWGVGCFYVSVGKKPSRNSKIDYGRGKFYSGGRCHKLDH